MNSNSRTQELVRRSKILVYFLAAPEEEDECQAIRKHLMPAVRSSKIPVEINSDFEIPAGEDKAKYKQKLFEADIVLALISSDYISDDDTYERTQKVIERYNKNETILVPILVRNCLWKHTPFVKLPLLPKNLQPLNNKQFWNSEDDALMAVVEDIYEAINEFGNEEEFEPDSNGDIKSGIGKKAEPELTNFEQQVITVIPEGSMAQDQTTVVDENKIEEIIPVAEPEIDLTKPVKPTNGETKDKDKAQPKKKKTVVPIQVDWRKQHYRQVIWKRTVAFFLDQFLVLLPSLFLFYFVVAMFDSQMLERTNELGEPADPYIIPAYIFYFLVCAFLESSKMRGTFGKRILKLQITDKSGERISFFRALWRNIARVLVGYSYIFVIPLIIQISKFKKSKKLFHDQMSKTVIGERLSH